MLKCMANPAHVLAVRHDVLLSCARYIGNKAQVCMLSIEMYCHVAFARNTPLQCSAVCLNCDVSRHPLPEVDCALVLLQLLEDLIDGAIDQVAHAPHLRRITLAGLRAS